jgi:hypothetical protein
VSLPEVTALWLMSAEPASRRLHALLLLCLVVLPLQSGEAALVAATFTLRLGAHTVGTVNEPYTKVNPRQYVYEKKKLTNKQRNYKYKI